MNNIPTTHCPFCKIKLSKSGNVRQCRNCKLNGISKYEVCIYVDGDIVCVYFIVDHAEVQVNYSSNIRTKIIDRGQKGNEYNDIFNLDVITDFDFSSIDFLRNKINLLLTFQ